VTRKLNEIRQIFENIAKTVAKISKLKLKVLNICTQLLLMLKLVQQTCLETDYLAEKFKQKVAKEQNFTQSGHTGCQWRNFFITDIWGLSYKTFLGSNGTLP
jgi:hypothetical protein